MDFFRGRRLRESRVLREMMRESHVSAENLVHPVFVTGGSGVREPIESMPGQFRLSCDELLKDCDIWAKQGLRALLLFGIPEEKDSCGSGAWNAAGPVQQACRLLRKHFPQLLLMTDVCLCEYTSHGHCGIVSQEGHVNNDETLPLLGRVALSHAEAGAQLIAPSDMMDGRIGFIRSVLDQQGFPHLPIMSYAAKYASAFYGPFREAAGSTPQFGDRRGYQMDPANRREALREIEADIAEGADIVMVKPGLAYLDVLRAVAEVSPVPVAVYNVSGEYSMVKIAAAQGVVDEKRIVMEIMVGFRRAGANMILSYHTPDLLGWWQRGEV